MGVLGHNELIWRRDKAEENEYKKGWEVTYCCGRVFLVPLAASIEILDHMEPA